MSSEIFPARVGSSTGPTRNDLTPAESQAPRPATDWLSIAQLGLSAFTALSLWGIALLLGLASLGDLLGGRSSEALSILLLAAGLALSGLLVVPSAWYAGMRLAGRPAQLAGRLPQALLPSRLIFLLPVALLLGYLLATRTEWAWLGLPPLHLLAIGLPVLWALYLAVRGLPLGSLQRRWGVFASGLVLGPVVILLAEIFALVLGVIAAGAWLAQQPGLEEELMALFQQYGYSPEAQEEVLELLLPYLASPLALLAAFTFTSGIVPVIEELFKPVGVWLLAGRELRPAAGFALGAVSGAGYALFESLALASSGEDWLFVVVSRSGTGAVHILTTALTGWGIAGAWRERRYLRLGAAYLTAVAIHGLWNTLTLFTTVSALEEVAPDAPPLPEWLHSLGAAAPFVLGLLTLGVLVVLVLSNRALKKREV